MTTQNTAAVSDPVRTKPFPGLPPRFDGKEAEYLLAALKQNNLFYMLPDGFVSRMLKRAVQELAAPYAVATSSGTASLHVAVGAAGVEPGMEVITSPITDMGTCIAILYQNAIPIFADVDPRTYNLTAQTIEAAITERTRAVIVVHLRGSPCDMEPIVELCRRRSLFLIEDCAQAWGATYRGKPVGNFGQVGCYSLNNFKHLSCGDGGLVVTQDEKLHHACHNYADKFYDRAGHGDRLSALAPNYRMSELQGAVALAQFDKLHSIANKRHTLAEQLTMELAGLRGILPPRVVDGAFASDWFYMFRVDPKVLGFSRDEFTVRMGAEGIPAGAGYIAQPICQVPVFLKKSFFPGGVWPAEVIAGRTYDYRTMKVPIAEQVLASAVTLQIHEGLSPADVNDYARAVKKVVGS